MHHGVALYAGMVWCDVVWCGVLWCAFKALLWCTMVWYYMLACHPDHLGLWKELFRGKITEVRDANQVRKNTNNKQTKKTLIITKHQSLYQV